MEKKQVGGRGCILYSKKGYCLLLQIYPSQFITAISLNNPICLSMSVLIILCGSLVAVYLNAVIHAV